MGSFTAPKAEDVYGQSDRLEAEGVFHFQVKDVKVGEMAHGDKALDGFSAKLSVLEGEHSGKEIGINFLNGQPTHKDGGESCNRKQAAFCIATNLLTPAQLTGGEVSFNEEDARGQQVVAEMRLGKANDSGKRYLELFFSNIYHVDDPRVKDVPKNAAALSIIPAELRRNADFFTPLLPVNKRGGQSASKLAPPAADLDLSGL